MDVATVSSKYQLVIPRGIRDRIGLRPGARLAVLEKGGIVFLIPERPMKAYRGIARRASPRGLRDKEDRV